jgi:hypothetical protein
MRLIPALSIAAAMVALAGCSAAGGGTSYGGILKVDTAAHTVTLDSGSVFQFDPATDLSQWAPGDDVVIAFTTDATGKKNLARKITPYCFCVQVNPFA